MGRPRLLVVGQGLRPTGYARVTEEVLGRLWRGFEVLLFAVNLWEPAPPRPFAVRENRQIGDPFGREQLPELLDELGPKLVLIHHDASFYPVHAAALDDYRRRRPDARVVVHCPIDWPSLAPGIPKALARTDRLVLYTRFGRRVLGRAARELGLRLPPAAVIPHGVDRDRFRPLLSADRQGRRALARQRLFPDRPDVQDAFIVLNANGNTPRKRIDLTLRGFASFAGGRPDARLYLHTGMRGAGCDVLALADELGIADRLLTTTREPERPEVSDEQLNVIYNACDVGLNTCAAEGWGLVSFEHAAAGVAQIVPDHSACGELWRGRALLVPASASAARGHLVSPEAVAAALGRLHRDHLLRAQLGARGQAFAASPCFGWAAIARRWEHLLRGCLSGDAHRELG